MRQCVVSLLESGEERYVKVMIISSEHYTCVCRCMSVEEAGAGERGRECKSETLCIYFRFIVDLNVPSSAHMSVIKRSTSVHITVNSQSSNSQHQFTLLSIHSHQTVKNSSHCCQFTVIKQSASVHTAVISQSANSQHQFTLLSIHSHQTVNIS